MVIIKVMHFQWRRPG